MACCRTATFAGFESCKLWKAPVLPLEGLGQAIRSGVLSLGFIDSPSYDRWGSQSDTTFQSLSEATGVPVALLTVIREAMGSAAPSPDDRVRERRDCWSSRSSNFSMKRASVPGSSNGRCACTERACGESRRPSPTGGRARS